MPPSSRWIDPNLLEFSVIQTRILRFITSADPHIKSQCGVVKKEHFNVYKAYISHHNARCFPSQRKRSLVNLWATAPAAPVCIEKALQDLKDGLPENFIFNDII
jgi:hypothetical protein